MYIIESDHLCTYFRMNTNVYVLYLTCRDSKNVFEYVTLSKLTYKNESQSPL